MFTRIALCLCAGLTAFSPAYSLPPPVEGDDGSLRKNEWCRGYESNLSTAEKTRERLRKLWEETFIHSPDCQFINKVMGENLSALQIQEGIATRSVWKIAEGDAPSSPKELVPVSDLTVPLPPCGSVPWQRRPDGSYKVTQHGAIGLFLMCRTMVEQLNSTYSEYTSTRSQLRKAVESNYILTATLLRKKLVESRELLVKFAGETVIRDLDKELDSESKTNSNI